MNLADAESFCLSMGLRICSLSDVLVDCEWNDDSSYAECAFTSMMDKIAAQGCNSFAWTSTEYTESYMCNGSVPCVYVVNPGDRVGTNVSTAYKYGGSADYPTICCD